MALKDFDDASLAAPHQAAASPKPGPLPQLDNGLPLAVARDVLHKLVTGSREQRGIDKVWGA